MGSTSRLNVKMAAELSHRCLVVDVAPHGHHGAAMFVVARLCVFAGPKLDWALLFVIFVYQYNGRILVDHIRRLPS